MKFALSFDDVLLVPKYTDIASRKDVDVSTKLSKNLTLKIPLISSCMDTVTEAKMAITLWRLGGLGILHRYNTIEKQLQMFREVCANRLLPEEAFILFDHFMPANCGIAIGATGDYLERAKVLYDNGANIFCVDVAHGDSKIAIEAVKAVRSNFPDITLIAGNVATGEGFARLIDAGADAVRVSVGGGSLCSTQRKTACGLPTLQALFNCQDYLYHRGYDNYCMIADGGIKESGEIVKSIAAGANAVMLGQLFAATKEAPGEIVEKDGKQYKSYQGMASFSAQSKWRPEKKDEIVPEGEDTLLLYKGSVKKVIQQLIGGLRSGMTYNNARTLKELQEKPEFIQISNAGWKESTPHAKKE
jgi:IMP dehydrogenase